MTQPGTIRSGVLGLAAGDALSWTAADHREYLLPERRLGVLRILDTYADQTHTTTRPRPHVHSSPTRTLRPGPSDDLEWFVFTATALSAGGTDAVGPAWRELAGQRHSVRARIGTSMALDNLAAGLEPPQSGHDNAHYFDDIACVRAVAAGLLADSPEQAMALATADAEVTHALDGLWCAQATAVLIAQLANRAPIEQAVDTAVAVLPEGSWSRRTVDAAVLLASQAHSALDLAHRLDSDVVDKIYSYAVSAPETLALLLAHSLHAKSADDLMLGAFGQGRNADALPALAGAVAGVRWGHFWVPTALSEGPVVLDGICVPVLAGTELDATIRALTTRRHATQPA